MTALYELREVSVMRGDRMVLQIAQLSIDRDCVTAFVGPNGAGKTTLLELLAFLRTPASGTLSFDGDEVDRAHAAAFRMRVGLVPQNPYLFDRSVRDNLLLGLKVRGAPRRLAEHRVDQTLERLGLTRLSRRHVRSLSGGEGQKVALARTIALQPEVLLLDEPFSYLDAAAAEDLAALIANFSALGARAVIFTAHDELLALRLADHVINVVGGRADHGSLLNLYKGSLDTQRHLFDTGHLLIHVADHIAHGSRIALDPGHVVLSRSRLESSMQNTFPGRISSLREQDGEVLVTVEAGLRVHARVTHRAVSTQRLRPGVEVWVSFKSNAVRVL